MHQWNRQITAVAIQGPRLLAPLSTDPEATVVRPLGDAGSCSLKSGD